MAQITNNGGLSLAMAVWLATDPYTGTTDDAPEGEMISVTTLMKPTRQFVLSQRMPVTKSQVDVLDFISARLGHAIHSSVEEAWLNHYASAMHKLGYPKKVIEMVRINPTVEEPDTIPVYLEQRSYREIDGVILSGQLDQIIQGELNDTKTTSVWSYMRTNKDEDYIIQLSCYRWLNPDKVTSDIGRIQHVFTDWQRMMVKQNPKYPPHRVMENSFTLMSLAETERWIRSKLKEIRANVNLDQVHLIRCNSKELWVSDPQYKYYADASKTSGRSTKNFDDKAQALAHCSNAGKGTVITVPGEAKACGYCFASPICEQRKEMFPDV